ncbi:MAG: hypothetical protein D6770_06760 [Anaerolineae bacterium]|nr:MAG: hypothetical protein D6770_06760 [Anaerolineae bacterium]
MSELPVITRLTWGQIEVTYSGKTHRFRDCKIGPQGAREWNWKETGTRHQPGIQVADIEEILGQGVEVVILGCGRLRALGVTPEVEETLKQRNVEYHIEETGRAVELYNRLASQGRRVGGLFHTTC